MGGTKEIATETWPYELGKPRTSGIVKRKGLVQSPLPSKEVKGAEEGNGEKGSPILSDGWIVAFSSL